MNEPVMPKFPPLREPVLSQEAIDLGFKYAKDPKLAAAFLKRIGIMDENGQLAEPYRL